MRRHLLIAALLFAALAPTGGCSQAQQPPAPLPVAPARVPTDDTKALAQDVANRYGLTLGDKRSSGIDSVPADLSATPDWGVTQPTLLANGYDLRPFAGKTVQFDVYSISERYESSPVDLVVISCDGELVGVYTSATDYCPGPISMQELGHPARQP